MKPILLLDNYDSFTYNLLHYIQALGAPVVVYRNDEITIEDVAAFDHIILSPGPGLPDEAGIIKEVIARYASEKPILGICLGMQAIGEVFGAKLQNLNTVHHGIATTIEVIDPQDILYQNLPQSLSVGRYHSWIVDPATLPETLVVTAQTPEGHPMSMRHRSLPIYGVQYHPESILTPLGKTILHHWLTAFYFK